MGRNVAGGVALVVAALAVAACSSGPPSAAERLDELRSEIARGSDCGRLFAVYDQIPEDAAEFADAQGAIIDVGCYSRDSMRSDNEPEPVAFTWSRTVVTRACDSADVTAASVVDPTGAEAAIAATLDACETVDEWMSALADHPEVMGMARGYVPRLLDLQVACHGYPGTKVCRDALGRGLNVAP